MKKYISLLLIACGILAPGCKKILEPTQIDLIYNEVFWETPTDAEVGVAGVYALYRGRPPPIPPHSPQPTSPPSETPTTKTLTVVFPG